jgi:hypothetical protein
MKMMKGYSVLFLFILSSYSHRPVELKILNPAKSP